MDEEHVPHRRAFTQNSNTGVLPSHHKGAVIYNEVDGTRGDLLSGISQTQNKVACDFTFMWSLKRLITQQLEVSWWLPEAEDEEMEQ